MRVLSALNKLLALLTITALNILYSIKMWSDYRRGLRGLENCDG